VIFKCATIASSLIEETQTEYYRFKRKFNVNLLLTLSTLRIRGRVPPSRSSVLGRSSSSSWTTRELSDGKLHRIELYSFHPNWISPTRTPPSDVASRCRPLHADFYHLKNMRIGGGQSLRSSSPGANFISGDF